MKSKLRNDHWSEPFKVLKVLEDKNVIVSINGKSKTLNIDNVKKKERDQVRATDKADDATYANSARSRKEKADDATYADSARSINERTQDRVDDKHDDSTYAKHVCFQLAPKRRDQERAIDKADDATYANSARSRKERADDRVINRHDESTHAKLLRAKKKNYSEIQVEGDRVEQQR